MPKVSVVIPTFNRAKDLKRCLDSLVNQDFKQFEVIVCDDGSTDNSSAVVESYKHLLDIHYSYDANFGGPARPRNRGLTLAKAQYVAFLDSDDWWTKDKLSKSLAYLDAGADLVYHDLWNVISADQTIFKEVVSASNPVSPLFRNLLCDGISIPNSSVVMRKKYLEIIGGISEDRALIAVEDWDTWIRVAQVTEHFVRIPDCLGFYWNGGGNITEISPKQILRVQAIYDRHLNQLSQPDQQSARAFLAYRIGRIAQLRGDFAIARENLWKAVCGKISLLYRFKAFLVLTKVALAQTAKKPDDEKH